MHGETATENVGGPQRFALLASALAGRTVAVASGAPGEPAWTDGITVFVDAAASLPGQRESVTVQASLLASGGLNDDVVRKLVRRPALARRYLAVEGHRALSANDDLLPPGTRSVIDLDLAAQTDSPADSLRLAAGGDLADPPPSFGVIRARNLLAARTATAHAESKGAHAPRRESNKALAELEDDDADGEDVMDPFSSPVGGGGVVGKLLQRLMSRVRQLSGEAHRGRTPLPIARTRGFAVPAPSRRSQQALPTPAAWQTPRRTDASTPSGIYTAADTGPTGARCSRSMHRTTTGRCWAGRMCTRCDGR